jgi:ribose transport system ATP-binding protein
MANICKSFNKNVVLESVDFELRRGEVHVLAGGNGAGKSTLVKILQGVYSMDSGSIEINGQPVEIGSIQGARAAGIGMVFQEFSLIPTLSVAQNVFLGSERRSSLGFLDDADSIGRTRAVFAEMGVEIDPTITMGNLGTAYWQLTEIAKAMAQDARVLILDEPTASLAKDEVDALFALVRRLTGNGISVIYISHRMDEIFRIGDRITVLRDGQRVLTSPIVELTAADVVHAIVGRKVEGAFEWKPRSVDRSGAPLLEVRNLNVGTRVRDVSFTAHRGEIIGLAGLMGAGRTELARALFGIDHIDSGEVLIRGQRVHLTNSGDAIAAGVALIPEDRRAQGLVLEHSVRDNLLLTLLGRFRRGPLLNDRKGSAIAAELINKLSVKAASQKLPVGRLSGGNQQKVVIGKWLGADPDILIMDEPTAGVDIGTKTEIVERIRGLADLGKVVIVISSELPELLAVADRVIVLRSGTIDRTIERADISDEHALQLAIQGVAP